MSLSSLQSHLVSVFTSPQYIVTRSISIALVVLTLLGVMFPVALPTYLGLTPAFIFNQYYLWTFVTSSLLHTSILIGALNTALFLLLAADTETHFGSGQFLALIGAVAVATNATLVLINILLFAVTFNEFFVFRSFYGMTAVNAALTVALKQRFGERVLVAPAIRYSHIVSLIFALSIVLIVAQQLAAIEAPAALFGVCYGWLFCRYYRADAESGLVGDLRPEFAFSTLFPDIAGVRALVDVTTLIPYQIALQLGLFAAAIKSHSATLPTSVDDTTAPPAVNRIDPAAERRRALAIKAIDDKLAELARAGTSERSSSTAVDSANVNLSDAELDRLESDLKPKDTDALLTEAHAANALARSDSDGL